MLLMQVTRTLSLPLSKTVAKITYKMQKLTVTDPDNHTDEVTCSDIV